MRIVSGKFRGRRLKPPTHLPVRPTTDFAKEGLFNVLGNLVDFETLRVLDLFAGTGSISFEFISRGAVSVTAVDINTGCVNFIRKTAEQLEIGELHPVKANVLKYITHGWEKFDLIFADPPYDLPDINEIPDLVLKSGILENDGLLILEHGAGNDFAGHPLFSQRRHYGSVNFSFFRQDLGSTI
jgi:16S rRNA (guanine(966)-N(2))-methyltransferase RsmD